jgi:hypothetical protein
MTMAPDGSGAEQRQAIANFTDSLQLLNLPGWARTGLGSLERLNARSALNPFYQSGDFDGDGALDAAILVTDRRSGEVGVLILHGSGAAPVVLGAGAEFGNGGTNFSWMTNWTVVPRRDLPDATGDVLQLWKAESAGGRVLRDDDGYRWLQWGD